MQQKDRHGAPLRRAAVLDQLPISPSDFVVEVGAGPTPFRHTKLIIDKYPFENTERHGDIVNMAPIIKADAMKIPVKDKGCDVLFVSHVLEHIEDPGKFIGEARRCANHVYLEFPTVVRELMYAWSFHKWLIEVAEGQLVFYKNDIPQLCGDFFHSHYDFLFDTWSEYRFAELNSNLYLDTDELTYVMATQTALEYVLDRSADGDRKINFRSQYGQTGTGKVGYPMSARLKLLAWAMTPTSLVKARNRIAQRHNRSRRCELTQDLVARLLCQRCRAGSLRDDGTTGRLVCNDCDERYVATNGVFDFDF